MLKIIRSGQRWLTAVFVVGIGGVFVFFLGLGGSPLSGRSQSRVVVVGPYTFGNVEFERIRGRREALIQQQMGDAYDARSLSDTLDGLAARELLDKALLALAAEDLGLTVSKREIEEITLSDPGFRNAEGRFDQKAFEGFVEWNYGSQANYMRERRLALLANKMLILLTSVPHVSDREVREAVESELEEVRIAFVALDGGALDDDFESDSEAIQAAIESRADELELLYEELRGRYDTPEEVSARHILIRVERDADETEIETRRELAQSTRDRIVAGEDFAALAAELSDDEGSRERDGDLGFFRRGQMVPAFEEVAFTLEPGQMSDPVRTEFGFHVILVEEHRSAHVQTLEEVREELAQELLKREAGDAHAWELAEGLASEIRNGASLETAARDAALDVKRSGALPNRADGFIPGLGAAPQVLATAFAMESGASSPRIFEVNDKRVLVQVLEHEQPEAAEIDARIDETRERLQDAKRDAMTEAWLGVKREELLAAGALAFNPDALDRRRR